jgi:tagatose-1,6-bisphosphate aldolase non-catalytic subunit AgaZ/GatZ
MPPAAYLGVGPMSAACVNATISIAQRRSKRLMLIASRRQIDREEVGGGYVEGWDTEAFAKYVRQRDINRQIILCRDHGGPWQHPADFQVPDESSVMQSAFDSFTEDVRCGFQILHIDTSRDSEGVAPLNEAIERLAALYREIYHYARGRQQHIDFEIGFEDQSPNVADAPTFFTALDELLGRLRALHLPVPMFVVGQTGTKVQQDRNIGRITDPDARREIFSSIYRMCQGCRDRGLTLKAHNADYLAEETISELAASGVGALNIAPELGVTETALLLQLMRLQGLDYAYNRFVEIANESQRWRAWTQGDTGDTLLRAKLAGHYVFANPEVRRIRAQLETSIRKTANRPGHLSNQIEQVITSVVNRYLYAFPLRYRL